MPARPKRPVTFTCEQCYQTVTEARVPGPVPSYCMTCRDTALRASNAARVQAHRLRKQGKDVPSHPPGRPRKDIEGQA
jgi:hypothetical protein